MNDIKIGTYNMQDFGLYLPEYVIPAPAPQTKFVDIIGRDGPVDLSNALGNIHYGARKWTLNFKCFDPTVNWHTLTSNVMKAIHGKRLNFEFADDPNYFWTGRFSVVSYTPKNGEGTIRVDITSDPFKYTKLSTIVQETVPKTITYSGAVASFTATADNGITSLSASITPAQDLHGYSSPWPAGGGNNLIPDGKDTAKGYTASSYLRSDGDVRGSASSDVSEYFPVIPSTVYGWKKYRNVSGVSASLCFYDSSKNFISGEAYDGRTQFSITSPSNAAFARVTILSASDPATIIFVAGDTYPDTWEPYANICPITGFTGANIYVSPTQNQADATTYTSDWTSAAGTVYAGSYDVVSGKLKARPQYASYNGETLVGPWLSSMDVYEEGVTPTTGAQVVDLGGTETEYTLTPQTVSVLVGQNYVWSNTGDVSVDLSAPILLTNNGSKPVVPTVTASAQMTLMWDNYTYTMNAGTAVVPQLVLNEGTTKVFVDGTGTIKFEYSEASL